MTGTGQICGFGSALWWPVEETAGRETGPEAGGPAGTTAVWMQDQDGAGEGRRRWTCLAWGLVGHGKRGRERVESRAICCWDFRVKGPGV